MQKIDRLGWAAGICFVSYGLRIGIRVNRPELLDPLEPLLPPGWKPALSPAVEYLYSLRAAEDRRAARARGYHLLFAGARGLGRSLDLDELYEALESHVQLLVAEAARRRVFVHAGVVGWRGRAILFPGRSFSGKTTLVAALVRAGATYYSDEYAVLDERGRVHPYPRRLSVRETGQVRPRRCTPEALGGRAGTKPLPIGLTVLTSYQPGARWRPRKVPAGQAALALLDNSVPARRKPAAVLDALQQVVSSTVTVKGVRGEAEEMAADLLERVERADRWLLRESRQGQGRGGWTDGQPEAGQPG
jgi:hypothetical protein